MPAVIDRHINKLPIVSFLLLVSSVVFFVLTRNPYVLFIPVFFLFVLFAIANWKHAYWFLIFSIPLSVQFGLDKTLSLSLPDEPICWLFLLILILLVANDPRIIPRWVWKDPVLLIVLLQLFWLVVAVGFSTVFFLSVKFLLAKIWYLACFFIMPLFVFQKKEDFKNAFVLFLVPLLITIAVVFCRHALLSFKFANVGAAVGNLYINHVEYAAIISIFFPLIWAAYRLTDTNRRTKMFLFILILFFIPVVFFSYARVAVLAIAFAAIIGWAIRARLVNYVMPVLYGIIGLTVGYFIKDRNYISLRPDYDHTYMHSDYGNHLLSTFQRRDMSSMERVYRWVAAVRMSGDRPIVGFGPHAFVYNYKPYALNIFKTYVSDNAEHSTTHNYFLFMLTEQGWPAMLLYALLVAVVLVQAQKTYHRFKDTFYKYCTLGLAMAFASSFVNNFFSEMIETHKVGAMFYLTIALLMILRQKSMALPGKAADEGA